MGTQENTGPPDTVQRIADKSPPPQFLVDAASSVNAGRIKEAIDILEGGIEQDSCAAYSAIGQVYLSCREYENALGWLEKAHQCQPDSAEILLQKAQSLTGLKRWSDAIGVFQQVLDKDSLRTDVLFLLGKALKETGQLEKAEECFKQVLKEKATASVLFELESVARKKGCLSQAVQYRKQVLQLNPNNPEFLRYAAEIMVSVERKQLGINLLRMAAKRAPKRADIGSSLLHVLHFSPNLDGEMLFQEHKQWGRTYAPMDLARRCHDNDPDPDRRLRIGYISPNFYRHSVAFFFESLLDAHNRNEVEVYGYGDIRFADEVTERLKPKFCCYRDIRQMSKKAIVDLIEQDNVDILVDLAGHTKYNKLTVLAHKPAPVQVTYLGYPNTTGMEQIDYRFTDDLADTADSQKYYTEELVFLPEGFLCYRPADFAPPVTPLPAMQKGYITFGCFNCNPKINPYVISMWAQILNNNKDSRFILKFDGAADAKIQHLYTRHFARFGIPSFRLDFYGLKSPAQHLALYGRMDIALDTYPYNGTTTTFEALWMGVPVVSLAGSCHASRVGLSILSRLGLGFLAASSPAEYVAKALALAEKTDQLAKIRDSMRARMAASSLCNAKQFAENIEAAYRRMWQKWCRDHGGDD